MNSKWTLCFLAFFSAALFSGCVNTVDGRQRAGVPFQNDRAEGKYPRPPSELWAAAKDVMKHHGTLSSEDVTRQSLQGIVDNCQIWMAVSAVDPHVTQVVVQARSKGGVGEYKLASYLQTEIAVRLATGTLAPSSNPTPAPKP